MSATTQPAPDRATSIGEKEVRRSLLGTDPAAPRGTFTTTLLEDAPEPVRRHLCAAIALGTPLACGVELEMRGQLKLGRWLPFRASQVLVPSRGTLWSARVAGVIRGNDRYADGSGGMDWKALGLVRLVHVDGDDVSRSSAERAGGESVWAPTAMVPSAAVRWTVADEHHIASEFDVDGHPMRVEHTIDDDGNLTSSSFLRWGDPEETGTWAQHPFGMEVTGRRTFGGVTVPSAGRAGWHFGTDRWEEGVFFRFEITGYRTIGSGEDGTT